MVFTLWQLYKMNESKPFVKVTGIDDELELQWDYCDLEGLPPKRTGITIHDMGKISTVPHEELPKTFCATRGGEYIIEHIHTVWESKLEKREELKINTYGDDDWATPVKSLK